MTTLSEVGVESGPDGGDLLLYPIDVDGRVLGESHIRIDELEDWFNANADSFDVPEEVRAATREAAYPRPNRTTIVVNERHLDTMRDDAIRELLAFNIPPTFFQQGGYVAEVRWTEHGRAAIHEVREVRMRERLADVALWVRRVERGNIPTKPDLDVAKTLLVSPKLKLPPLYALTEIPVLRPDGKFTLRRGYDRYVGVFFAPAADLGWFQMSDRVSKEEVLDALHTIDQMIGKFPWVEQADKVNALAFMLTPILRPVITGPTPMAAVSAPHAGTGKTLLVESIVRTLIAKPPPVLRLGTDENEVEKRITAFLRKGPQFGFLDNIPTGTTLDSAAFASLLTSDTWSGRIIMTSEMPELPNVATWVATGNALSLGPEIARRSYLIELDAHMDADEVLKRRFAIDLPSWVPAHRKELLLAAMTLVRAWTQAGMPLTSGPVIASYENWSYVLGGVMATLREVTGRADLFPFLGNEDRKRIDVSTDVEDDTAMWMMFVHQWAPDRDWSVRELLAASGPGSSEMLEALPVDTFGSRATATTKLGYVLRTLVKGTYGGFRLEKVGRDTARGGTVWAIRRVGPGR